MTYLSIDHLIVYAFLLITLLVGLWAGKGVRDIRDYAIANKRFSTVALVLTWLATDIGGGNLVGCMEEMLSNGVIYGIVCLGLSAAYVVRGIFIAPKITRFKQCLTMGHVMGELYGPLSRVLTGLINVGFSTIIVAMQVQVLGKICESLLAVDPIVGMVMGGLLMAAYSAYGGLKAVTATDVLQFLVLILTIPLIASLAIEQIGGMNQLVASVPAEKFKLWSHDNFSYYFTFFIAYSCLQLGMMDPALIQRMLMAKAGHQLRTQYLVVAAFQPVFLILLTLIAFSGLVLYPNVAASEIVPTMVNGLFATGGRGLVIAGLLAVLMSTGDSYLHVGGLAFVNDVLQPVIGNKKINALRVTQYTTFLLGMLATVIGIHNTKSVIALIFYAMELAGPVLMLPFITGIMGLKTDRRIFFITTLATLLSAGAFKLYLPAAQAHFSLLLSVLVNGVTLFGLHLIKFRGFAIVSTEANKGTILLSPTRKNFYGYLKSCIPTLSGIVLYSQKKVEKYGAPDVLFGIFCCTSFTLPYFMWSPSLNQSAHSVLYLRVIGTIMAGLLIVKDKWPKSLLKYMPTYWHLTLLYCIPFISTVMFLLTQGSVEWLINVALTIMFLIVLVDWATFFLLMGLGMGLGLLFHMVVIGPVSLQLDFTTGYLLAYQSVFAVLIGLLFARRRQQSFAKTTKRLAGKEAASQRLAQDMVEERDKTLRAITGTEDLLIATRKLLEVKVDSGEAFEKLSDITTKIIPIAFQLHGLRARAQDYLRLKIDTVATKQLLATAQAALRDSGIDTRIDYHGHTQHEELVCDEAQLKKLLLRGMTALSEIAEEGTSIMLSVEDTQLIYPMPDVVIGYEKEVQALRIGLTTKAYLPKLAASYAPDLTSNTEQGPLATRTNRRIVKAHYGYMEETADTLLYVVPADVKEVRPRDMDKAYMEVGSTLTKANDKYKGQGLDAEAQEQALLAAVKARSDASLGKVILAIELIKWLHGPVNRKSGEPFYLHPLAVAQIVLEYSTAEATILGALLHDTVEDTAALLGSLGAIFGRETADVVDVVTHLQSYRGSVYKVKLSANENLQMLVETENKEALYVKIADRMHNVRTIEGHDSLAKQQGIASETLEFFVPLSKGLGLSKAAEEFEERCKAVLRKKA